MGCAKLLAEFKEICKKHDLKYWLESGTLIGAVRHEGSIPWDDDVDVSMLRSDIEKLQQNLKDSPDYQIEIVLGWYYKSRQIRFRTRNPQNPCFVDIFIYDLSDRKEDISFEVWQKNKIQFEEYFENSNDPAVLYWRDHQLLPLDSKNGQKIDALMKKQCLFPKCSSELPEAIIYGLDNPHYDLTLSFLWEDIFPLKQLSYEGVSHSVPHKYLKVLNTVYEDIYRIPDDLNSHFQHFNLQKLNTEVIEDYLNQRKH